MGISGNSIIRNMCDSSLVAENDPSLSTDVIEVEIRKKKMKISAEAWRAFQVYQQYDDWSNQTEKTDYTYSRLSKFKHKEIIPGFAVRPNLSRSPIKPSTPNSLYDYTSERAEEENRRNRFLQNEIYTEHVTFYQKIVMFWFWVRNLVQKTSQGSMKRISSGFLYISTIFTSIRLNIVNSFYRIWSRVFSSRNEASDGCKNIVHESISIVKNRTHKVTTFITNTYYTAMERRRRNFLWLLLPVLLLLLGWLLSDYDLNPIPLFLSFAHKTSKFCLSVIPDFTELFFFYWFPQNFFTLISESIYNYYSYALESVILALTWLSTGFLSVYHSFSNITYNVDSVRLKIFGAEFPINGPLDI